MTISEQDYLKAIYELGGDKVVISNKAVAQTLKLSPPSVSEMLKRLTEKSLIEYTPYKGVMLTNLGIQRAAQVIQRHKLWELWLVNALAYPIHLVHEEAERLEHVMSEELENRLYDYLGSPQYDILGKPLPSVSLEDHRELVALDECQAGATYSIGRLSDDIDLLEYFRSTGLVIGDIVVVVELATFDGPITLQKEDQTIIVGNRAAKMIYVIPS